MHLPYELPNLYQTQDLPGLQSPAQLKMVPEDFIVEELPAYTPSGSGEHLFIWLEKTNMAALQMQKHLAHVLRIPLDHIGCAGLKDTRAVTRQYVSVPKACEALVSQIDCEQLRVLSVQAHGNKLKTGHLRGNKFRIRVHGQCQRDFEQARVLADALRQSGLPNFYGPQRFGHQGETIAMGLAFLQQEKPGRNRLKRLALSAVQSAIFNAILARRLADRQLQQVLLGDVCLVCASGGPFVSDDPARETQRLHMHEIVSAGPMLGPKMRAARAIALQREQTQLAEMGIDPALFSGFKKLMQGTRRANLVWVDDADIVPLDAYQTLEFSFSLPPGSYATVYLREFWRAHLEYAGK